MAARWGTKAGGSAGERVRTFVFKNPVLLAVVAGLLAPAALAPAALVDVSHVIVFAALPWGFFCAGVILAEHLERGAAVRPALSPPVGAAIVMRLVLAPLLLLLLAAPFIDLPPAYLLAAATPAGSTGSPSRTPTASTCATRPPRWRGRRASARRMSALALAL